MSELPPAFTVAHARAQGTGPSALRSRVPWSRPFRGLRASVDATWVDVVRARVAAAGEGVVVFGPSALRLWGLELPAPHADDGLLHLAVPRRDERRGVRASRGSASASTRSCARGEGVSRSRRARGRGSTSPGS